MRHALAPLITGFCCAAALAMPISAGAEACVGPAGQFLTAEAATAPVTVVAGRSIGPIKTGMSHRAITKVAGPAFYNTKYRYYRFRVSGMAVRVFFGHWGRARALSADSGKFVLNGVLFSAGADAVAAAAPGIQRSDCGDHTEFFLPMGRRQTSLGFFTPPALPRVVIINTAMRR